MKIKIDSITVENRFRKDLGDIDALAASMAELGQLQPIIINAEWKLIAGERRLEAAKRLGWEDIEVNHIDSLDDLLLAVKAERDENTCRKDFEPSELVALGRSLEEFEKEAAKKRQQATQLAGKDEDGKPVIGSGTVPEPTKGDTRDKVGKALGVSGRTYEKAKQVVEAAEADPEKFGHLVETMDKDGVAPAHREMKSLQSETSTDTATSKRGVTFLSDPWRVFCTAWDRADEKLRKQFVNSWNPNKLFEGV